MKLIALSLILAVSILQSGCVAYWVTKSAVKHSIHRAEIKRAEKRGEKRAEKRHEKEDEARAPAPSHIDKSDLPAPPATPPEAPAN